MDFIAVFSIRLAVPFKAVGEGPFYAPEPANEADHAQVEQARCGLARYAESDLADGLRGKLAQLGKIVEITVQEVRDDIKERP